MTVKASRYLTHVRRLRDPAEPVRRLLDAAAGLGDRHPRVGPVLPQLPPDLQAAPQLLDECLRQFPPEIRVAVDPRHESWWAGQVRDVLTARNAALCWADRKGPRSPRCGGRPTRATSGSTRATASHGPATASRRCHPGRTGSQRPGPKSPKRLRVTCTSTSTTTRAALRPATGPSSPPSSPATLTRHNHWQQDQGGRPDSFGPCCPEPLRTEAKASGLRLVSGRV